MGDEAGRVLLGRVNAVRRGIEAWRSQRPKSSAMPEGLWLAAVALAREHGVYAIARSLGVDYGALKRRVVQAVEGGSPDEPPQEGFVEVRGYHLLEERATAERMTAERMTVERAGVGSVVEMSRGDGSRLTVRLSAGAGVDVVGLAATFWRRER